MSNVAFGKLGVAPTWCSSDEDFITTALGTSRLWATIGHGIINEVCWPSTGKPQIRDWNPRRDVLLIRYHLDRPYRLAVILAPHLQSTGHANHAWIEAGCGFARREDIALCLAADAPLEHLSCGYVGFSDGWQDLNRYGSLTYDFTHANEGTVSLSAEE